MTKGQLNFMATKSSCQNLFAVISCLPIAWFGVGCANTEYGHTSPYHPGPVVGTAAGNAAGVVAGNAVGVGVGAVEGAAAGLAAPFDPSYHMVRQWKTETTSDGRTIQVPVDILVDKYGRPVGVPAPTGNSPVSPPAAVKK